MSRFWSRAHWICLAVIVSAPPASAQQSAPTTFTREQLIFFEEQVRPVLHNNCVMCHSAEKRTSGLSLETREDILTCGNRGPAADPGRPDHSRLVQAILFTGELKMPPMGKLKAGEIAAVQRWVELGLPSISFIDPAPEFQ